MTTTETCSVCGSALHSSTWCPSKKERWSKDLPRRLSCPQACPGLDDHYQIMPVPEPDPHSGEHKCSKCGSNSHPTKWCPRKDGLQPMSTFCAPVCNYQVFAVFDIPSVPPLTAAPVDQVKPSTCRYCGSTEHKSIVCPSKPTLYNPGPKTECGDKGYGTLD
jgi:hypothetical protein